MLIHKLQQNLETLKTFLQDKNGFLRPTLPPLEHTMQKLQQAQPFRQPFKEQCPTHLMLQKPWFKMQMETLLLSGI